MCENYKEEFSSSIDRDEVFDELSERIANYWDITIEWETYEQKIYEAIDKTITSYTKDGNLYIVIKDGAQIEDYFDKESIDDPEDMSFHFKMYHVG